MWTGGGGRKPDLFVDVLNGWPLSPVLHLASAESFVISAMDARDADSSLSTINRLSEQGYCWHRGCSPCGILSKHA